MSLDRQTIALLESTIQRTCGAPMAKLTPGRYSNDEVMRAMWQLNDLFRARHSEVRALPYEPALESAADEAIERFALAPMAATWISLDARVLRVLFERHVQALTTIGVSQATMVLPMELPASSVPVAAMSVIAAPRGGDCLFHPPSMRHRPTSREGPPDSR